MLPPGLVKEKDHEAKASGSEENLYSDACSRPHWCKIRSKIPKYKKVAETHPLPWKQFLTAAAKQKVKSVCLELLPSPSEAQEVHILCLQSDHTVWTVSKVPPDLVSFRDISDFMKSLEFVPSHLDVDLTLFKAKDSSFIGRFF